MTRQTKRRNGKPNGKPAAAIEKQPVTVEIGDTGLEQYGGLVFEERLRQLQGELALRVFREMSDNDPIVGALLFAIRMLVRKVDWDVEPGGDSPQDEAEAEYLRSIPDDMSHSWPEFISEWANATLVYGFGPFEVVYKRRQGEQRQPGLSSKYADGRIGVRKLAIRPPDSVERWLFDADGGIQGMVQRLRGGQTVVIPIEKLLLFRTESRKNDPQGRSILRNAYVPWFRKKHIEQIEAIGVERDLAGLPLFRVPGRLMLPNASAADRALLESFKRVGRNLRNDEQSHVILPSDRDPNGEFLYDLALLSTGGRRQMDISPIVERYARHIAMTVLADVILIGHEQVGSFALSSSKSALFAAALSGFLDDIEQVLNRHLVPRLYRLNGVRIESPPRFRHGTVEAVDMEKVAESIAKFAGAGMAVFPTEDGELEREILRRLDLPDSYDPDFQRARADERARMAAAAFGRGDGEGDGDGDDAVQGDEAE